MTLGRSDMTFIKESVQAAYGICRKNCPLCAGGKTFEDKTVDCGVHGYSDMNQLYLVHQQSLRF